MGALHIIARCVRPGIELVNDPRCYPNRAARYCKPKALRLGLLLHAVSDLAVLLNFKRGCLLTLIRRLGACMVSHGEVVQVDGRTGLRLVKTHPARDRYAPIPALCQLASLAQAFGHPGVEQCFHFSGTIWLRRRTREVKARQGRGNHVKRVDYVTAKPLRVGQRLDNVAELVNGAWPSVG